MIDTIVFWVGSVIAAIAVFFKWKSGIKKDAKKEIILENQNLKFEETIKKSENAKKIERSNAAVDDSGVIAKLRNKWQRD